MYSEAPEHAMAVNRLVAAGMGARAAAEKGRLFERTLGALGSGGVAGWFVPGRIEFLGKHTDYAGGRSLLCAVERGICLMMKPRSDAQIIVTDAVSGERMEFALTANVRATPGHWSNYFCTAASRLALNFPDNLRGAEVAFASDLPPASGMSSSSALVVAMFLALSHVNGIEEHEAYRQAIQSREDLCEYLGTIENGQTFRNLIGQAGVGTFGGSQDHTAILCSKPGRLVQYGFDPARLEAEVKLPAGYEMIVAASGALAEKGADAQAKFNALSQSVSAILKRWQIETGEKHKTLASVVRSQHDASARLRDMLLKNNADGFEPATLLSRLDQFIAESERIIPATTEALSAGDIESLGNLVDESQALAERALVNQVPETIFLAQEARRLGAAAASAFGAGFGGSVWALIKSSEANPFWARWTSAYAARFPNRKPTFFFTTCGPPAMRI